MSNVFVLDTMHRPLDPIHPGYARKLLSSGKAAVFRRFPFTLLLKVEVQDPQTHPLRIKLDPGSKTTGIALVNDASGEVVWAAELTHRGQAIKDALERRRAIRRSRRQRKTRYRKPRFDNRRRKQGWLSPSLESRIATILTWVHRLSRSCPVTAISQELVRFDMALMQNAEIRGIEYQQGELQGYELREYVLEKWDRTCAYCGKKDVPLQIEHIQAKANGGSNRVSNLTLACEPCNTRKGTQDVRVFLAKKLDVLKRVLAHAEAPLKDAAAVNATRWALYERLKATGLPVECGTGGMTKFHRTTQRLLIPSTNEASASHLSHSVTKLPLLAYRLNRMRGVRLSAQVLGKEANAPSSLASSGVRRGGLDKAHWIDAACVGASTPDALLIDRVQPLFIKATGYGNRQMCLMDKYGFPRTGPKSAKVVHGFQTGDMVKAIVTTGKKVGTYIGRVAVRATGSFNVTTQAHGTVQGINYRACTAIHTTDGYSYSC